MAGKVLSLPRFEFQYALIRNNWSINFWVEYWTLYLAQIRRGGPATTQLSASRQSVGMKFKTLLIWYVVQQNCFQNLELSLDFDCKES